MQLSDEIFRERQKVVGNYFKHLTTASTGIIVLVFTFCEKNEALHFKLFFGIGLLLLFISMICSFTGYTMMSFFFGIDLEKEKPRTSAFYDVIRWIFYFSFSLGIGIIALLSFLNV